MALAVCLLFDDKADRALRALWTRLELLGVPTLHSHTHGHHAPHLSLAVLREYHVEAVLAAVSALPEAAPTTLHFDAVGLFRRGRCWLVPAVSSELAARQERVVRAVAGTGADLHRHYRPGLWVPHCTVAPRLRLEQLPTLASAVYDVLPMEANADRAALIDSSTGERWPLPHCP